ncbi:MAG: twin-arginine translocase subunit TatC [Methylophilaceae bacterium]|jgi:sec-independent protein translocase protein TatC
MKNKFSYLDHIFILKKVLIRVLAFFALVFSIFFYFHEPVFNFFSQPLQSSLENTQGEVIATQLLSTFVVPLKLSMLSTFYLISPYLIGEIWFFIKPGLYQDEKKFIKKILMISMLLVFVAFCFCFYIVFPQVILFFINFAPEGLSLKIDINFYLELLINLIFAFTVAFQIPIIVLFLTHLKIMSITKLKKMRPYIYVFAFILGAVLTPPDVLSQILLGLPMIFLFEFGLYISNFFKKI